MSKPTPQQEKILAIHRDGEWHCSTEYEYIRDHRKRISELNEGYLKAKGWQLIGQKCDGRCGKNHSSALYMRKAIPLKTVVILQNAPKTLATEGEIEAQLEWFEALA